MPQQGKWTQETMRHVTDCVEKYIPENVREKFKDAQSRRQLLKDFTEIRMKFHDVPANELYQKYYSTVER